jgi:hypothetical protein
MFDSLRGLVLDEHEDVVTLSVATSNLDYGGPLLERPGAVLAKYGGADGAHVWSRSYGAGLAPSGLAVDGEGDLFVSASLVDHANLGTGKLAPSGVLDALFARFDDLGNPLWVRTIPASVQSDGLDIFAERDGHVVVAVSLTGDVTLPGGLDAPTGVDSLLLVRLDGDGNPEALKNLGGIVLDAPVHLQPGASDDVVISGGFSGTLRVGAPLTTRGNLDAFVAHFLP